MSALQGDDENGLIKGGFVSVELEREIAS